MPLPTPAARREIHHRIIDMTAYGREDGLYDIEAHLVDTKPFDYVRPSSPQPTLAGHALHDLWVRLIVDENYTVRDVQAASDVTPWGLCKEAESTLQVLVGERLVRGWSSKVKERLRGAASCTHLMEMLVTMATTALQGIRGLSSERSRPVDANGVPLKLDTCYAYARQRDVVKMLWPQHHRPSDDT